MMQAHVPSYRAISARYSDTMKVISTKPLPQNPWYLVSTCAQVYNTIDDRWLTQTPHKTGLQIVYYFGETKYNALVHRLVAEAHIPGFNCSRRTHFKHGSNWYKFTASDLYQCNTRYHARPGRKR